MFVIPCFINVILDAAIISIYVISKPNDFKNSQDSNFNFAATSTAVIYLACIRILCLIPLAYMYCNDTRIKNLILPYTWFLTNLIVVIVRLSYLVTEHNITRDDWLVCFFSLISACCQVLCTRHLKSSVLIDRLVVLDMPQRYLRSDPQTVPLLGQNNYYTHGSVYSYAESQPAFSPCDDHIDVLHAGATTEPSPSGRLSESQSARTLSSAFVADMKLKFDAARLNWDNKVKTMRTMLSNMKLGSGLYSDGYDEIFDFLLQLFTGQYDIESACDILENLFHDYPLEFEFYVPQLTVYLLYGSFDTSRIMQMTLLRICEKSQYFAHKLYWFINAFSLSEAGVTPEGVLILQTLMRLIHRHGNRPAAQLAYINTPPMNTRVFPSGAQLNLLDQHSPNKIDINQNSSQHNLLRQQPTRPHAMDIKIPPTVNILRKFSDKDLVSAEGRDPYWSMVCSVGSNPSTLGDHMSSTYQNTLLNQSYNDSFSMEILARALAADDSSNPQDQGDKKLLESSLNQPLPIQDLSSGLIEEMRFTKELKGVLDTRLHRTFFNSTISFWNGLVEISRSISQIRPSQRSSKLRLRLPQFINENLDSQYIVYAPVGELSHRVVSIQIEECFAFSTKDRAPIFLCLEIVDVETGLNNPRRVKTPVRRNSSKFKEVPLQIIPFLTSSLTLIGDILRNSSKDNDDNDSNEGQQSGHRSPPSSSLRSPIGLNRSIERGVSPHCTPVISPEASLHPIFPLSTPPITPEMQSRSQVYSGVTVSMGADDSGLGQWALPVHRSLFNGAPSEDDAKRPYLAPSSNSAVSSSTNSSRPTSYIVGDTVSEEKSLTAFSNGKNLKGYDSMTVSSNVLTTAEMKLQVALESPAILQHTIPTNKGSMERGTTISCDQTYDLLKNGLPSPAKDSDPIVVFKEAWSAKECRCKERSVHSFEPGWRLLPVIVKSGDDLRQEQCASQLIYMMHRILFSHCSGDFWLRPYDILAFSPDSGLIEAVPDTVSLDVLRKSVALKHTLSLRAFFEHYFGNRNTATFQVAQDNFIVSLATYSIVCYVLSLKDRHNGNILLDNQGHIIHIDFGYILAKTPGGNLGFEKAPFKLTSEFVELMEGVNSHYFWRFRDVCVRTFMTLRRHHHRIVLLLDMLAKGNEHLECFGNNPNRVVEELRKRFCPDVHDNAATEMVHKLIDQSIDNWTTTCYDRYQRICVGIL